MILGILVVGALFLRFDKTLVVGFVAGRVTGFGTIGVLVTFFQTFIVGLITLGRRVTLFLGPEGTGEKQRNGHKNRDQSHRTYTP
jgi:hypothetical protein